MVGIRQPRVVVTIHGIRTQGKWQKEITPHLALHGLVPCHIDFGFFGALRFFLPWSRNKCVESVRTELRNLLTTTGSCRISVIAHSFGTYLAMEALTRENGDLEYDRVVLTGSILPCDFDWEGLLEKNWVVAVRNERATHDWVVKLAGLVSRHLPTIFRLKAGDSGRNEFTQKLPRLLDNYLVGHHSETHNPLKFTHWARFIAYPNLPDDLLETIITEMQALRQEAASILDQSPDSIRINLFAPVDGILRIVPGAFDNMTYAPEFDLKIKIRHGATGKAFATGNPCLAMRHGATWTGEHLPGDELKKLEPRLRWVLSMPVKSTARGVVVGVVNVDGIDNIPPIFIDPNSPECQAAMLGLHLGMLKRFEPPLEAAFKGDKLKKIEV